MSAFEVPPRLLHPLGQLGRRKSAQQFEAASRDPRAHQEAMLRTLMTRNADTVIGRTYGFSSIRTPAEYAERVPLMSGQDLAGWAERLKRGERNLLTHEAPIFYGVTTGSSGASHKYVPLTPTYRREYQRTLEVAFWHLYRRYPRAFTSRFLYFVGARRVEVAPDGCDVGTMSGFNFTEQPGLVRQLYAWPYELFEVTDLETRGYLALHRAVLGDVSLITGVFPLPIATMFRDLEIHADRLANDFERGTLDGAAKLSAEQRAFFTRGVGRRSDLARRLREAGRAPIEEKARILFPKLAMCYCWTTSTAALYVPELKRRLGPDVVLRDAIYSATEAWCNVAMGDPEPGGPLAITSVYFEFIEERSYENGSRRTLTLSELEDGRRYYIVVSNSAGMFRYVLGDVVQVSGRYHATPRIFFVRKGGTTSNLVGELIDEGHVNAAVSQALSETGLEATWFALVGDGSGEKPGYTLRIELAPPCAGISDEQLQRLAAQVDARMIDHAEGFADVRRDSAMRAVDVVCLPQGRYDAWRQRRVLEGSGEAQLKPVHLVPEAARLPEEFR